MGLVDELFELFGEPVKPEALDAMNRLAVHLAIGGYEFERIVDERAKRNQIIVYREIKEGDAYIGKQMISAVCHPGSYGYSGALIEVWDMEKSPPIGHLTPEEALSRISEWVAEKQ